ncbi:MAG: GEVED domain-containing protein [Chitinophagales bacterium]
MLKSLFNRIKGITLLGVVLLISSIGNAQYCTPDYITGTGDDDYIDGVELGDISNFTGAGDDWNDYTDLSTTLTPGLSYDLVVYSTPFWDETYAAWIDWNQDETFSDDERLNATDLVVTAGGIGTISFTVPFTAFPGSTRMRVMCVYFPTEAIIPCPDLLYNYGEAEDYTINIPAAGPYDIGATTITGIASGCGLGVTPVTINITNFGTEPTGSFQIAYQVTDPTAGLLPAVVETYPGPAIPSLTTVSYTFSALANFTNIGDYNVNAYTIYGVDTEPLNDATDIDFTSIPTITTYPYYQNFEEGEAGWMAGGSLSTWELGDPAGFAIIGAPPATPGSLKSWTTELDDYYNLNEKSWVESPCYDFSSLSFPFMEFDLNYDIQLYDDGAKVQYSTDGGDSWSDLGSLGTGENWYQHDACYAMYPTFYIDNYYGWSGNSGGWLHAYHDLSFLAGETDVKFRFVFASSSYWNFNDGFAFDNMWIGDPYPNDIGVSAVIDPESGPFLTASENVTVEVTNYGTLSQSGFPVSYQFDGGTVVTETFAATLAPGASANYTFGPTVDLLALDTYALVAWTNLATDEDESNDTLSVSITHMLPISGTGANYIYSNVPGGEPWFTVSNDAHMDDVFGAGEWTTDYYETVDPVALFSVDNCFIFMEGSDAHAEELESFLNTNMLLVENWVAAGGHLFINAAPNEGDGMNLGFGGTTLSYPWYASDVTAFDPLHPIWDGPFTPTSTSMNGFNYGHAAVNGSDWTPIIYDEFNPDKIIAAEKSWGAGMVVFGGMTVTDFHAPFTEAGNFRKNIISYLASCTISDNDVGVQSITAPVSGCSLSDAETVTVKVKNFGFMSQTNIPVKYQADGGVIVTEIIAGPLNPGEDLLYTFTTTVDLSALGDHDITAWTALVTDTIYENDTTLRTILNVPYISSYPYFEDWETGDGNGWYASGTSSTWELGFLDGPVINTPPVATPESQNSWATSLTANYNDDEESYLASPCFDLSSLLLPYVEVDLWWVTEDTWDGMQLEYTTDGVTWNVLGDIGTGENWYTNYAAALDGENGWVGNGPGWVTSHHDIAFLAGAPYVKFRFKFVADGIYNFDGIGLDNFRLQDPFPNDLGVYELLSPVSGPDLTASEAITVNVRNYGTLPQSGFNVSYKADGGPVITEIFTGTLAAGTMAPFTFATTADLSTDGFHDICSWTSLPGDEDITNDSIFGCATIYNFPPVSGTGAYYIYSSTVGYEPGYMNSNTTAMDAVFGADAWTLDYYESLDLFDVFGEDNCFIFLEGSESHWSEFSTFFNANKDIIEGWVASGGNLFINASPWEGSGGEVGFGGVEISYPYYTYETAAVDPLHPVLNGPFIPVTSDLYGYYVGYARVIGDFTPIISDISCDDCYLLGEKEWGEGRVMFGSMNVPEYYSPSPDGQNLRQNIIDYIKLCSPVDIGVTTLISPEGGCGMTSGEEVTIEITNFGPTTVTNTPVKYQLDGALPIFEIAPGPIPTGGTYIFTFDATADLSAPGDHDLLVWTDFSGDEDETNDELFLTLTSLATPSLELGPNKTICDITTLDAGNIGSTYLWNTGATTQTINVTETGEYTVTVTNPTTGCSVTDAVTVTVNYTPEASFTYTASGLTITFTNGSTDGASYNWSFGDGGTSTSEDPSHTYATTGTYTVTVTVTNGCGSDFYSMVIEVTLGVEDIALDNAVAVYPNPTSDFTVVTFNMSEATEISLELVNTLGQTVWSAQPGVIASKAISIDMTGFAAGVYQLNINSKNAQATKQIIVTK